MLNIHICIQLFDKVKVEREKVKLFIPVNQHNSGVLFSLISLYSLLCSTAVHIGSVFSQTPSVKLD